MRKVVTSVLAILIAGTGGYFGARGWAQQRVEQEVETSLAAIRAGGGNVTHGPVEIELLRRQVSLSNVVAEMAGESKASLRIGRVVATGIGQPGAGRISAAQLEIDDLEIDGTIAVGAGLHVTYRIPRLEFANYSGPTVLLYPIDAASPIEAIRAALQQFIAVTASSLTIPTVTVSLTAKESPLSAVEYGYSGIVLGNIGEGRVGSTTVDRVVAAVNAAGPNGPTGFTAELAGMQTLDFDVGPILAVLSGSADDHYRCVYQKITAGSYAVTFDDHRVPVRMLIDGFAAEDVALKPSKFPLAEMIPLFSSLPRAGEPLGRVEMWRGGCRPDISVSAPFVWRCLSGSTVAPFPHPAHRTGHADLPHPALGQDLTPLLSRATPSAVSEPFAEFIGFPISQVLHHVLRLS